ncbi:MAG TPA: 2-phosphosulfolactate phosphatase [Verrucomicrobiae bacterium]|nr:2-phosphosulfolactate phosphatase [Verrucomicrobiae bacterium]
MNSLEVLFTPADFGVLPSQDLSQTVCVVFDILRATSSMITALANGAEAILPVEKIADALAVRRAQPQVLLAGERDGVRIGPELTGGISFDLGNSPREFTAKAVAGKTIVMTTTNGTRALNACRNAKRTYAGSFLNLRALSDALERVDAARLLIACSGTFEQAAYEDTLAAGALCNSIWSRFANQEIADSARMARELYVQSEANLLETMARASRNARRLLSRPDLREDVEVCLRRDTHPLVAVLDKDGAVRRQT